VATFAQVWELSKLWYDGRLLPSWRGRSAEETQAILKEVGLTGEFWRIV
jgi:hypothetical protein